jgi:hypothetical protein
MLYADAGDFPRAENQMHRILEIDPSYGLAREFLESVLKPAQ